jgi:four helix bundle protein
MSERPHHRLDVWKMSVELVTQIYQLTSHFPAEERFGLISQMRRAAISIPSNIAEGAARITNRDKLNFFHIGRASLSELETHMEIAEALGFLKASEDEKVKALLNRVGRMLNGLIASRRDERIPGLPTRALAHSPTREP